MEPFLLLNVSLSSNRNPNFPPDIVPILEETHQQRDGRVIPSGAFYPAKVNDSSLIDQDGESDLELPPTPVTMTEIIEKGLIKEEGEI